MRVTNEKIMSFFTKYTLTNKVPPTIKYASEKLGIKDEKDLLDSLKMLENKGFVTKLEDGLFFPNCLKIERKHWSGRYLCSEIDTTCDEEDRALDFTIGKEYLVRNGKLRSNYGYNCISGITGEKQIKEFGFIFTRIGNKYIKE